MLLPDLRFLSGFSAIYQARNLTRAARRLGRTQPAVTYQLRRLEEELGERLFVRVPGGMNPTPAADALHALVGRFAAELDQLLRGDLDAARPLAVASVSVFGRYVVAPILRAAPFDRQPISLRFPVQDEVVDRTIRGECDVGFAFRAVVHPALASEPVFDATYALVAGATWARRLASPARFQDVPMVTYDESDYVVGRWLGHQFGRRAPRWHSTSHFEEIEEVMEEVAAGRGVAVVPSVCIPAWRGAVRCVEWGKPPLVNRVHAIWRTGAALRPSALALLAAVRTSRPPIGARRREKD